MTAETEYLTIKAYQTEYSALLDLAIPHKYWDHWAGFYDDARQWIGTVLYDLELNYDAWAPWFADCVAALSPLKTWTTNQTVAVLALSNWIGSASTTVEPLPVLSARAVAAQFALRGEGVSGPKLTAFARNLRGDYSIATIDRHMLDMVKAKPSEVLTCQHALAFAAQDHDLDAATAQAGLWGYWRAVKGYATYGLQKGLF